jgi:hypothetical protein
MRLSPHEVADLAIKAGFSKTTIVPGTKDTEAVVAVAVAFAESSADTDAISRTTASTTSDPKSVGNRDHGIFQLSGRWQYDKIQAAGGRWRDPSANVKMAYDIFKAAGRTFTPWMVFAKNATTGIAPYEQFLPDARLGVMQPWPYVNDDAVNLKQVLEALAKVNASLLVLSKTASDLTVQLNEVRKHFS